MSIGWLIQYIFLYHTIVSNLLSNVNHRRIYAENFDRFKEIKEFDESRTGVKGLVDAGLLKVPCIFIHPKESFHRKLFNEKNQFVVPMIDLSGLGKIRRRREIVDRIRETSEEWGFFQMINHGIRRVVMEKLLEATRRFHEQPSEAKVELYSRDRKKKVRFVSNGDMYGSQEACWRDTLACQFSDDAIDLESLPMVCRKEIHEHMKCILKLKSLLSELLSEVLGLSSTYLSSMACMKNETLACLYYPLCSEPNLTIGARVHSDPSFLTLLLQDDIGGLQVLHRVCWVDVPPVPGALVANLGDFMQIITNGKLKSVKHRVLAGARSRSSAACFFSPSTSSADKAYGPIKELLSPNFPPKYRDITASNYFTHYQSKGPNDDSPLLHFKQ